MREEENKIDIKRNSRRTKKNKQLNKRIKYKVGGDRGKKRINIVNLKRWEKRGKQNLERVLDLMRAKKKSNS